MKTDEIIKHLQKHAGIVCKDDATLKAYLIGISEVIFLLGMNDLLESPYSIDLYSAISKAIDKIKS